jgi:hypothetical protein
MLTACDTTAPVGPETSETPKGWGDNNPGLASIPDRVDGVLDPDDKGQENDQRFI